MKKTYINPTMNIVEIKATHQLLAGSVTLAGELQVGDPILAREFEAAPDFEDESLTDPDDDSLDDFDDF
jgi:hypothetical protein